MKLLSQITRGKATRLHSGEDCIKREDIKVYVEWSVDLSFRCSYDGSLTCVPFV